MIKPPWWFCNGWWSPWCVLDEYAHRLLHWDMEGDRWLCRKHAAAREQWADRHPI